MFVITADQVDSRTTADAVGEALATLNGEFGESLVLPAERTAGDELQLLLADADAALAVVLALTRGAQWSVGCGVGDVRAPLPRSIRESTGPAFIAARAAVDRAKRRSTRFALESMHADADDVEALIDLLLIIRSRRSSAGWELHELVSSGLTQAQAADRLGITPQAASSRAQAAELKAEFAVTGALAKLLERLDRPTQIDKEALP
ncbi:MAG: DNA-binding protein [Lacisediminihabitans sp.]